MPSTHKSGKSKSGNSAKTAAQYTNQSKAKTTLQHGIKRHASILMSCCKGGEAQAPAVSKPPPVNGPHFYDRHSETCQAKRKFSCEIIPPPEKTSWSISAHFYHEPGTVSQQPPQITNQHQQQFSQPQTTRKVRQVAAGIPENRPKTRQRQQTANSDGLSHYGSSSARHSLPLPPLPPGDSLGSGNGQSQLLTFSKRHSGGPFNMAGFYQDNVAMHHHLHHSHSRPHHAHLHPHVHPSQMFYTNVHHGSSQPAPPPQPPGSSHDPRRRR